VWRDLSTDAAQAKRLKQRKDDKVKVHATERAEARFWDHWLTDGREPHLFVCDVESGRCRDLLAGTGLALPPWEPSSNDFDIAPDGREIAMTADLADEPGMLHKTDIVTLDLRTRRKRVLTPSTGRSDSAPRYSPDGRVVAYLSHDTERSHVDQGHLEIVPRAGGRPRALAPAFDRAPTHAQWARDGRGLLFTAEDRGRTTLFRLMPGASRPVVVAPGGTVGDFAQSRDGATIAFDRASSRHPPALFAAGANGERERRSSRPTTRCSRATRLGETREDHGERVGRRAGPGVDRLPAGLRSAQEVAAAALDPRRPARRARRRLALPLERARVRRPRLRRRDDQLPRQLGLRPALPRVDRRALRREGVRRHRGDDRRAAAHRRDRPHAPGRDRRQLRRLHGGVHERQDAALQGLRVPRRLLRLGQHDGDRRLRVVPPRARRVALGRHGARAAPVAAPPRRARATPTLVVHGEQDYRVPATQALQYYHTLKAKKVPSRLVYFPDENHWILKPQNSIRWYREFFDWVTRYAKGGSRAGPARRR
jgi:hypothetical protein